MIMEYVKDNELKKVDVICDCGSNEFVEARTDNPVPGLRNEYKCTECGHFYKLPLHWVKSN